MLAATATALTMLSPTTGTALFVARLLPITEPHAAAAIAALSKHDFSTATAETKAELAIAPISQDAWLRLAEVDISQHHKLTSDGNTALSRAYDTVPYDLTPSSQRLRFALQNFSALSSELKASVRDEVAIWAASPALRQTLQSLELRIKDPDGYQAVQSALSTSAQESLARSQ